MKLYRSSVICFVIILTAASLLRGQTAYFADGYHGGIYGHYPSWQAGFMVDKLEEFPEWKINLEIEPETWDVVKRDDTENYNRLREYYTSTGPGHRIDFVNPSYAQPYCYNISGESIIRHFLYGMEKVKEHFPDAIFDTYSCEEPCFTSCLPQLLLSLGFKYAVLRNPDTCWGGYTTAYGKDLVIWKASDGSSILSVPRYGCEDLVQGSTWQTESWNNSESFIQSCFDNGIKYPAGMCFQDAGWRGGPWLGSIIKSYYQPSEFITWTDYIGKVKQNVEPVDWAFTIEDVKPGLVWGAQILQKLAQEVRATENKLTMAEKIAVFGKLCCGVDYPESELDEAWRCLMLSQHHDCWIVPYNKRPGGNWATNVTEWTTKADMIADKAISSVVEAISGANVVTSNKILVFNTLGSARSGIAKITIPDSVNSDNLSINDISGRKLNSQIVMENGKRTLVFYANVPAFGYSVFKIESGDDIIKQQLVKKLNDGSLIIDTDYYTARIDPAKGGVITSLLAKKMGNIQLVDNDGGLNDLCGYFYQKNKYVQCSDQIAKVNVIENGPLFTRIQIENELEGSHVIQNITFYADSPLIDFELNIDWQENAGGIGAYSQYKNYVPEVPQKAFYNDKYKLHIRFPLRKVGSRIFKNAPFDVCESKLDNTYYDSWDAIKHNVILNWVDAADKGGDIGVALFSDHTTSYLNSDELPLGLNVQYIGRGLWGRDYTVKDSTHLRYALLPHEGIWEKANINSYSEGWNKPFVTGFIDPGSGMANRSIVDIVTDGVQLVSTYIDSDSTYLRLFNAEAETDEVVVDLSVPFDAIELIELNGKLIDSITPVNVNSGNQQIKLEIPRFGVRTIRLK